MLVAGSIYEACKYYELFQSAGFRRCAIVSSYRPNINDIKGETTGEDKETEDQYKYEIYTKMLKGKDPEVFEEEVKRQFVNEPAQMRLLIVVDKLLTGFDAPPATYLYIDKKMQDHGLFQAICRVNRLDGEDKQFGYIIDYKDLFMSLEKSIKDYTGGAFDGYDDEDVAGLLKDRVEKARERLDAALESVKALCEPVPPPKDTLAYIHYFCAEDTTDKDALKKNEEKRVALYKLTAELIRAYASISSEMTKVGYTLSEAERIRSEVDHYDKVREEVMKAAGDYIDLKRYEAAMRHLIDTYISAEESRRLSALEDMTLIDLIVERGVEAVKELPESIRVNEEATAEAIENNIRKLIVEEMTTNPKYYEKMSELLDELIKARKAKAISYQEYLNKIAKLAKQVRNPGDSARYPESISNAARRALYDNLDGNEKLAVAIDNEIRKKKPDGWRGNRIKERVIINAIKKHINDKEMVRQIFEIVKNQDEY